MKKHYFSHIFAVLLVGLVGTGSLGAMEQKSKEALRKLDIDFLYQAIYDNNIEWIKDLVASGVDISHQSEYVGFEGVTPLHYAILLGRENIKTYLVANGANIKLRATALYNMTPPKLVSALKKLEKQEQEYYYWKMFTGLLTDAKNGGKALIETATPYFEKGHTYLKNGVNYASETAKSLYNKIPDLLPLSKGEQEDDKEIGLEEMDFGKKVKNKEKTD